MEFNYGSLSTSLMVWYQSLHMVIGCRIANTAVCLEVVGDL